MVTISALQRCLQSSYTASPKVINLFEVLDAKHGLIDVDDIRYHYFDFCWSMEEWR